MKIKALLCTFCFVLLAAFARAADATVAGSPLTELEALVNKIGVKLKAGEKTAESLAPELKEFEALENKYRDQRTEEVGRIHLMHAMLYAQIFGDLARGKELFDRIQAKFPGTKTAASASNALAMIERQAKTESARATLTGQPAPELNFSWSTREGLKKLSDLKGKVVVLDFWATWCGPCVSSFPNVRELTAHYKDLDVVVIGVTSLQGRVHGLQATPIDTRDDAPKEFALMKDYIKAKEITWTIAFSEEEVFNPDYGVTGIPHMAIVAPDGTVRHSGMHPASPHEEKVAKIDALLKEFGKPTSAQKVL